MNTTSKAGLRPHAKSLALASVIVMGLIAQAAEAAFPIEIRGFGTGGVVKSSDRHFFQDEQTNGTQVNYLSLSRLGINLHAEMSDEWSASAQLLSTGGTASSFATTLDWGFVSWSPSPALSARAGVVVTPIWLFSQQIDVGYSYLWPTPPIEVYSLNPIKSLSGASVLTKTRLGIGIAQLEIVGGGGESDSFTNRTDVPTYSYSRISNAIGGELSYNIDDHLMLRASYLQADANVEADARFAASGNLPASQGGTTYYLGGLLPNGTSYFYGSSTKFDVRSGRFFAFGLKGDYGNWILISEFARRLLSGSALTTANGFYGTLGYNWNRWTPLFTYAAENDVTGSLNTHPDYPFVTAVETGEYSYTMGLDYHAFESVTLKSEVSNRHLNYTSSANNIGFNVYRLAVDFIF